MDRRLGDILTYCSRTGCQEVLLFTSSYDKAPSFVSLQEIQRYTNLLMGAAHRLRSAGIVVSVNVLQTVGHIYFPEALQKEFPFRRRVYSEGTHSREGACPLDVNLRDWVVESYRIYARLQARVMFVDDDFRAYMQGLSCFCPEHLRLMSEYLGRDITREEMAQAVHHYDNDGVDLRRAYWLATTQGFREMAALIENVVHSVSPSTRLGGMSAAWPNGAFGQDWAEILKVLAGPHQPLFRPQINMYSEGFLRDMPGNFTNPSSFRATLPPDVEYWPEIENYQYGPHAKSAQCTFAEIATTILQGFDHAALNVFDMYGTPFADDEGLIFLLERKRPYLDSLQALVPEGSRPVGVRVLVHPRANAFPSFPSEANNSFSEKLPNLGLPICHEGPSKWTLLLGRDAQQLSEPELDEILSGGALLDASAVRVLVERGYSQRIGVDTGAALLSDDLGYEEFCSSLTNPTYRDRCFPLRALIAPGDWVEIRDLTGRGIESSIICDYRQKRVTPAVLLTENRAGERFGILAWSGNGARHLIENRMRAEQLRQTLEWIARTPLPCAAAPVPAYLWIICNHTRDGRLIVGVINLSTDTVEEIPLIFSRESASQKIEVLNEAGRLVSAKITQRQATESETRLTIQLRLAPLDIAALVCE